MQAPDVAGQPLAAPPTGGASATAEARSGELGWRGHVCTPTGVAAVALVRDWGRCDHGRTGSGLRRTLLRAIRCAPGALARCPDGACDALPDCCSYSRCREIITRCWERGARTRTGCGGSDVSITNGWIRRHHGLMTNPRARGGRDETD
jgi:hypothetical protein